VALTTLPLADPARSAERIAAYAAAGATRVVHAWRYTAVDEFAAAAEALAAARLASGT
jgi:hypothetical protein